jgi:aldehyde dehydrogenase (NAD+)
MDEQFIKQAFESKREYFDSGNTKSYEFRVTQLKTLRKAIEESENEILDALYKDMHKPKFEAFTSEIGIIYDEIDFAIKNLKKWMKPKKVSTPLVVHPSTSKIHPEPLGVVLIIGPWNYPFQLLINPLVGAIAAGNCAILKPSDNTRNTAQIIEKIISNIFPQNYVSVVQGPGAMVGPMLIEKYAFNHIFFTGSPNVGKQIMAMASEHLTPVTLELGGKSPAIVHSDANLKVSAQRLIWAKLFNAGQTCVSPDYLLVHESVKDVFVDLMQKTIVQFLGNDPSTSENFTHIVNSRRFNVLKDYLKDGRILHGGRFDETKNYIEPTLIDSVSFDDKLMQEEIFGPILPILTYSNIEEVVPIIRKNRYPLALYLFTANKSVERYILSNVEFGGGSINNALVHLVNPKLPFGGIGNSGMGSYHGKRSFETMSHMKSVIKTSTIIDPTLRYAPYNERKFKLAKFIFN